jgi:hypothetical protein
MVFYTYTQEEGSHPENCRDLILIRLMSCASLDSDTNYSTCNKVASLDSDTNYSTCNKVASLDSDTNYSTCNKVVSPV